MRFSSVNSRTTGLYSHDVTGMDGCNDVWWGSSCIPGMGGYTPGGCMACLPNQSGGGVYGGGDYGGGASGDTAPPPVTPGLSPFDPRSGFLIKNCAGDATQQSCSPLSFMGMPTYTTPGTSVASLLGSITLGVDSLSQATGTKPQSTDPYGAWLAAYRPEFIPNGLCDL